MDSSYLLALPEELIATIAEHVAVGSLLNFALTCSETHRHIKHRLAKNKTYHAEYKLQHDRHPLQVAKLLRLALNDPEVIWHLRAFESWGSRPGFDKWKSYHLQHDITDEERERVLGPEEDFSAQDSGYYTPEEMEQYRMIMLDVLHMAPNTVELWCQRIRQGWDEPIKGMLFALAPRLDRLNFIAYVSHLSPGLSPTDLLYTATPENGPTITNTKHTLSASFETQ